MTTKRHVATYWMSYADMLWCLMDKFRRRSPIDKQPWIVKTIHKTDSTFYENLRPIFAISSLQSPYRFCWLNDPHLVKPYLGTSNWPFWLTVAMTQHLGVGNWALPSVKGPNNPDLKLKLGCKWRAQVVTNTNFRAAYHGGKRWPT